MRVRKPGNGYRGAKNIYLEHLAFLIVTEPFVLDAYNHFVFEHGSILLRKQLARRLPFHLFIPEFLVREPKEAGIRNRGV